MMSWMQEQCQQSDPVFFFKSKDYHHKTQIWGAKFTDQRIQESQEDKKEIFAVPWTFQIPSTHFWKQKLNSSPLLLTQAVPDVCFTVHWVCEWHEECWHFVPQVREETDPLPLKGALFYVGKDKTLSSTSNKSYNKNIIFKENEYFAY